MPSSLLFAGVVFAGGALAAAQDTPRSRTAETYVTATIDAGGQLAIRTTDGRTVVVPKVADQTTFKDPVVSQNRTAVEVHSERLIETATVPQPCGQIPNPKRVRIPAWVKAVQSR